MEYLFAMRMTVAITDNDWFAQHASREHVDEVNFWKPSPTGTFAALKTGELFLFKLHSPDNFIAGGGFFTKFLRLPVNLAWEAFQESNGVRSLSEMRERVAFYRRVHIDAHENPEIGCILLAEPFFWPEEMWILPPDDFSPHIQQYKTYDSEIALGRELWRLVEDRLTQLRREADLATGAAIESHGFGSPRVVLPRLGQGLFRVLLTDAYERRCSITGERTLPVLDAVHIKPYSLVQRHELSNGLLMRSDLHRLFDAGYMTIDPVDRTVLVSERIRKEFENGRDYYKFQGQPMRNPNQTWAQLRSENLEYHAYNVFR